MIVALTIESGPEAVGLGALIGFALYGVWKLVRALIKQRWNL